MAVHWVPPRVFVVLLVLSWSVGWFGVLSKPRYIHWYSVCCSSNVADVMSFSPVRSVASRVMVLSVMVIVSDVYWVFVGVMNAGWGFWFWACVVGIVRVSSMIIRSVWLGFMGFIV